MKKLNLILLLTIVSAISVKSQVNGVIAGVVGNLTVVKTWGTNDERGFAYGNLIGDKISVVFKDYVLPQFGGYYTYARSIVQSDLHLKFDSVYVEEAKAIISGMNQANNNIENMDYIDMLVCNSMLDIYKLLTIPSPVSCSALLSWGAATAGSDLNATPVITRHLDWATVPPLCNNQVIWVNFPSSDAEQPWVNVGFAGMFSVLSGFNNNIGVFQNMMDDFSGNARYGMKYEPIWFALRKALERRDFNNDGKNNVDDVKTALNVNTNGYANGYLISAIARSTGNQPQDVAMIAEIAPTAPYLTFRAKEYEDKIPSDNLYTANYQIARNNSKNYCARYNAVVERIEDGTNMSTTRSWEMMRDYSHLAHNIQLMQYAPEMDMFKISVFGSGKPAYENVPALFSISNLLNRYSALENLDIAGSVQLYPNPAADYIRIKGLPLHNSLLELTVYDIAGKMLYHESGNSTATVYEMNVSFLQHGLYVLKIKQGNESSFINLIKGL